MIMRKAWKNYTTVCLYFESRNSVTYIDNGTLKTKEEKSHHSPATYALLSAISSCTSSN